jgi:serine/threonine-protein kinase
MAELLGQHPRVVEVYETFPVISTKGVTFAVAMELAEGTLDEAIADRSWPEGKVRSEICGLLTAVGKLHASGAVHRDITPFNVFVCGPQQKLKLGDFGIARHGSHKKGVEAGTFAAWFVPGSVRWGDQVYWTSRDDLWQVGQLAAVLLTGALRPISTREVKTLPCSDGMKLAIRRAIGDPPQRFATAAAMIAAIKRSQGLTPSPVRSLKGRVIVFTGPLGAGLKRADAARLAERQGAVVLPQPSASMDTLIVGTTSPHYVAGSTGGVKVLETMALQDQGYKIDIVTGARFRKLIGM